MNFMTRTGITISNTDFVADIDLNYITNGIGAGGAHHTVLALNAGTNPFYSDLSNIGGMPISLTPMSLSITSPQKGISVSYESDLANAPTLFQFKVYLNDGLGLATSITPGGLPVVIPGPLVPGGSSANYYIRLKRVGTTSGTLEIFSDFARTVLIGTSTFTIPASINSLNTVFIGTNERQFVDNMLTGSLDNLCISNTIPFVPPTCNVVSDDFSNAALWTHPVLPTAISCPIVYSSTMNISSNKFNFGQSRDNNMNYFYRIVPLISNSNFRADIDFKHTTNGLSAGGAGHTLLALNDGIKPFFNEITSTGGVPCSNTPLALTTPSSQNGIAVTFESDLPVAPTFFAFKVYLNVAGAIIPAGVPINVGLANTQFFISLERFSPTLAELRVYSDPTRFILVGTSTPFPIPASISGLNTVDIGTNEWQEADRMLTGFLKNLCISNTGTLANENFEANQTKIFPNPTNGIITIESQETINQIELFDLNGRKIYSDYQEKNTSIINLDMFSPGIYLLQIATNKGIETKRIMKN